ncbi:hypothetical protein BSL82_03700 [Tardibacter chloracetimidivorans]|uniref:Tail fiber domain-containing protein n=1 Tax=Tardibacter chloracetimidivorans TaxID=1921510 RepID=A0A1L3ZSA8_9SPHN|nr:hypothetical protein [Tardibacter chloracetimidivorans]API58521.1 hypothetical protein BSL82_03700 [Tardibacter chloracetimidivorans]
MGGLFGGSQKTTTNEKFDTGPSSWQKPWLDQTFGEAQRIYGSSAGSPYYEGETYAGMDADTRSTLERLKAYAGSTAMGNAGTISSIGSNLASSGSSRALSALDAFTSLAGENATTANIKAAQQYADNPHVQGMIDANSRDVVRNLNEETLPGIDRQATATGGINSSRAGVAAGIARRGAEDRIADISATLRGDAYNRGLSLAQGDRAAKLGALSTSAGLASNLTGQGIGAMTAGNDMTMGAFDKMTQAGMIDQADRQGQMDADFEKWQGMDQRDWDLLNRYYSIVGGNQWGQSGTSSGTSKTKSGGNIFGQLAGAAIGAAGAFSGGK